MQLLCRLFAIILLSSIVAACGSVRKSVRVSQDTIIIEKRCTVDLQEDYTWLINDTVGWQVNDTIIKVVRAASIQKKGRVQQREHNNVSDIKLGRQDTESQLRPTAGVTPTITYHQLAISLAVVVSLLIMVAIVKRFLG